MDSKAIDHMVTGVNGGIFRGRPASNEVQIGWDMGNPDEGYPCEFLDNEIGCTIHDNRPKACRNYPNNQQMAESINACTIKIKNGIKTGNCNGCTKRC